MIRWVRQGGEVMSESDAILTVKDLSVDFIIDKKQVSAISGVSFEIGKGKTLGVVGESGCGKSVTATSILRLLPKATSKITDGEIILDGENIAEMTDEQIRKIRATKISMIFQEPMTSLNPVYTIGKQMVEAIRAFDKKKSKKDAFEYGVEMLDKVGIPSPRQRMHEYPHQLSGGMRQRVMIAMALSSNPLFLIADEPTTALDVTIQAQILQLMKELKEKYNTAIMMITHDMGVVADVADEVMVMYAGKVVEHADVKSIFKNPLHPYTQGLLKSIPRMDEDVDELYTIEGTVPSLSEMPKRCRFCTRCPYKMEKCENEDPGLIQVGNTSVRCFKYVK